MTVYDFSIQIWNFSLRTYNSSGIPKIFQEGEIQNNRWNSKKNDISYKNFYLFYNHPTPWLRGWLYPNFSSLKTQNLKFSQIENHSFTINRFSLKAFPHFKSLASDETHFICKVFNKARFFSRNDFPFDHSCEILRFWHSQFCR